MVAIPLRLAASRVGASNPGPLGSAQLRCAVRRIATTAANRNEVIRVANFRIVPTRQKAALGVSALLRLVPSRSHVDVQQHSRIRRLSGSLAVGGSPVLPILQDRPAAPAARFRVGDSQAPTGELLLRPWVPIGEGVLATQGRLSNVNRTAGA